MKDGLKRQDFTVLDGGMGIELKRRGARCPPGLWSAQPLLDAPPPPMRRMARADLIARVERAACIVATFQ